MPPDATPTATAAPPEKLRRLPGRVGTLRLRTEGTSHLYLANASLVQIEVMRLRETYTKYAYKDIQALAVCRTARGLVYNVILGVFAALFVLAGMATDEVEGRITLGVIAGIFLLLLLVNALRGPTCRCVVQTATGRHRLPSLARLRPTRRAMALIAERVESVQGALDQATAARQMEEFLMRGSAQVAPRPATL